MAKVTVTKTADNVEISPQDIGCALAEMNAKDLAHTIVAFYKRIYQTKDGAYFSKLNRMYDVLQGTTGAEVNHSGLRGLFFPVYGILEHDAHVEKKEDGSYEIEYLQ
jgi:fructose 1,6-bisphosphatase